MGNHDAFDWKIGETHKFLVTAKAGQNPEGTIFSGYIYHPQKKDWHLMATFHTKVQAKQIKGIQFRGGFPQEL